MEGSVTGFVPQFIELNFLNVIFLILLGFLGGLTSGFIGSGGAFVLTPGMMSLGAPAPVAVASNMCHKFPKAMIGAYRRFRYGQVDIKLGLILAASAVAGVQLGAYIVELINKKWGAAGSGLYVSLAFVFILTILGLYMYFDSRRSMKSKTEEGTSRLAQLVKKIRIPPMINFKLANTTVSLWITIPIGFATGVLAGTISVGGFVGVPGMIYIMGVPSIVASATEMMIAFASGLSGTITYGLAGFVDIRMVLLILVGSLFGVQIGAIGTTYVKNYMVKFVMSTTMILVSVSRLIAIPTYLNDLHIITLDKSIIPILNDVSFVVMCMAMLVGGVIIIVNMMKGKRALSKQMISEARVSSTQLT